MTSMKGGGEGEEVKAPFVFIRGCVDELGQRASETQAEWCGARPGVGGSRVQYAVQDRRQSTAPVSPIPLFFELNGR
jgi:hypothetical protein